MKVEAARMEAESGSAERKPEENQKNRLNEVWKRLALTELRTRAFWSLTGLWKKQADGKEVEKIKAQAASMVAESDERKKTRLNEVWNRLALTELHKGAFWSLTGLWKKQTDGKDTEKIKAPAPAESDSAEHKPEENQKNRLNEVWNRLALTELHKSASSSLTGLWKKQADGKEFERMKAEAASRGAESDSAERKKNRLNEVWNRLASTELHQSAFSSLTGLWKNQPDRKEAEKVKASVVGDRDNSEHKPEKNRQTELRNRLALTELHKSASWSLTGLWKKQPDRKEAEKVKTSMGADRDNAEHKPEKNRQTELRNRLALTELHKSASWSLTGLWEAVKKQADGENMDKIKAQAARMGAAGLEAGFKTAGKLKSMSQSGAVKESTRRVADMWKAAGRVVVQAPRDVLGRVSSWGFRRATDYVRTVWNRVIFTILAAVFLYGLGSGIPTAVAYYLRAIQQEQK